MSLQTICTLLMVTPWLGIMFVAIAIYGTCWLNKQSVSEMYKYDISLLGSIYSSENRLVFTIGFVIASQFMICAAILKCWLMSTVSTYPVYITVLLFIASMCLSLMACIPPSIDHFIAAIISILLIIVAQIMDAMHWMHYRERTEDKMNVKERGLLIYFFIFPSVSILFFICWPVFGSWGEWIGVLLLNIGFTSQSIHGWYLKEIISINGSIDEANPNVRDIIVDTVCNKTYSTKHEKSWAQQSHLKSRPKPKQSGPKTTDTKPKQSEEQVNEDTDALDITKQATDAVMAGQTTDNNEQAIVAVDEASEANNNE
eukprot:325245_1